jgi:hypothetical protein
MFSPPFLRSAVVCSGQKTTFHQFAGPTLAEKAFQLETDLKAILIEL